MTAREQLVARLKERQGERTQQEYADFLGISRSMLTLLYSANRQVGMSTLTRICERFPDLAHLFVTDVRSAPDERHMPHGPPIQVA